MLLLKLMAMPTLTMIQTLTFTLTRTVVLTAILTLMKNANRAATGDQTCSFGLAQAPNAFPNPTLHVIQTLKPYPTLRNATARHACSLPLPVPLAVTLMIKRVQASC